VDDPKQRRPDISKAKRLLDWEPTIDLRTGLALTLSHLSSQVEPVNRTEVKPMPKLEATPAWAQTA